jgi:hypothetical protein
MVHSKGVASNPGNKLKQMISQAKNSSIRAAQGHHDDSDTSSENNDHVKKKKHKVHEKLFVEQ